MWESNRTNFDRNLAVVIGIDRYDSRGIHDLQTAVNDANAIANLLRDEYGYKDEHIVRLFSPKNDEATLKALNQPYRPATLEDLRILLTDTLPNHLKPTPADRLLFYFAGHGIPRNSKDGPAGYLVPQTAEQGNPTSFLPMRQLHNALSKLECHHLLVILDCCFAGTFRWASSRKAIPILETVHKEHYDRFIRYPAWQVLTSAAHDQEALDLSIDQRGSATKDTRHSPFALALIEGLRDNKADVIQDKVITAHELYLYLDRRVNELSREMQTPGIYPMRLDYDRGEYIFTRPGFKRDDLTEAPPLNEENNPYRGLKPFEERHSRFFFGRKALVEALSHRLAQSRRPLTVVLGASGSGKSSLVKAGLLPHLREKQKKEQQAQRWYILDPMRPGKSPFTELARTLLPVANSNLIAQLAQVSFLDKRFAKILDPNSEQKQKAASPHQAQPDSRERLSGDDAFDATKLAECWNHAEPEAKLLLVVDYFAQLQGFCHQPQEQEQLSSLYRAIEQTLNRLTQALQQEPQSFTDLMATWSQVNPSTKLLLVIDQFEELITMSQDDRGSGEQSDSQEPDEQKEWQHFLSLLRIVLAKYRRQLHVVLTLRSDFEPRFLNSALKAHWKSARFPVRAMNSDELRDAIERPALKQALYFEPPELVGKLIDEVGQMPGALPLLSFTLSELYIKLYERWTKDKSTDRALRIKDYEELGGVAGALTRRASQEYEALDEKHRATMRRVMLRMVTIEGGGVARRRVPESELVYPDPEENKRVAQVSARLVKARLLVKGQETGEPYVEPAHDFLVRGWDKLQGWKSQEIENLFLQQRLTPQANDWVKYPQNTELLMRDGYRLSALEEILNSNSSWFNQFEAHFVQTSISYRDMPKKAKLIEDTKLEQDERLIDSIHLVGENLDNFPTQIFPEVSSCLYNALEKKTFIIDKTQYPHSLVFHPSGRLLFVSGIGKRNRIHMINLEEGSTKILFIDRYEPGVTTGEPGMCEISPDGKKIIAIIVQRNLNHPNRYILKMWDWQGNLINGNGIFLAESNSYPQKSTLRKISNLFAPNSETLAVLICREDPFMNQILLIDNQGNLACEPILTESEKVSFSSDGKIIFDDKKQFWDLKGNRLYSFPLSVESINSIQNSFCESTYCQTVVSVEDESIKLWDLEGNLIHQFPFTVRQSMRSKALSPDGKLIAIGTWDGKVSLWDLKGNLLAETTVSLNYGVRVIEFSPNGRWIACGCENETVKLLRGGNWRFWLQVACDELYNHPTLKNPEQVEDPNKRDIVVSACKVCQKYVWGNTSPQRELDDY